MNLAPLIQKLRRALARLDEIITSLEQVEHEQSVGVAQKIPQRRGRKSMGPEERKQVSNRMKKYWASRRK